MLHNEWVQEIIIGLEILKIILFNFIIKLVQIARKEPHLESGNFCTAEFQRNSWNFKFFVEKLFMLTMRFLAMKRPNVLGVFLCDVMIMQLSFPFNFNFFQVQIHKRNIFTFITFFPLYSTILLYSLTSVYPEWCCRVCIWIPIVAIFEDEMWSCNNNWCGANLILSVIKKSLEHADQWRNLVF